jgi:uncharacterized protein (TIGR03435 family)
MKQRVLSMALGMAGVLTGQTPSFEAASVRLVSPSDSKIQISIAEDPGRIHYQNVNFKQLVTRAYQLRDYQVSGPAWIDTERYEVTATIPKGASKGEIRAMLQNLLAERFHLVVHRESKEVSGYALVVAKGGPKLKEVQLPAVSKMTRGEDGSAAPGRNKMVRRSLGRIDANGISLEGFANLLSSLVGRPVLDRTELKGAYDCTLEFTQDAGLFPPMMNLVEARPEGGDAAPPEPKGPSLFTALQEQLGLKLEARKVPLEILVVDRADKAPTEN